MEQPLIVSRLSAAFPVFVSSVKNAHDDFEAWVPEGARLTVEDARPKLVHSRTLHYLEMQFGRKGPRRIVEENDLRFLLVEGEDFDIGVRNKKLDEYFFSCNAETSQQESLRHAGMFFWMAKPTIQIFLGYKLSGGLQPSLTHIVLTYETKDPVAHRRRVEWIETLWTAKEGISPLRDTQENFLAPPPPPKLRRKRANPEERPEDRPGDNAAG